MGTFTLGVCFILGFMDGEAMSDVEKGTRKVEVFNMD